MPTRFKKELLFLLLVSSNVIADTVPVGRVQLSGAGATYNLGTLAGDAMTPLVWSPDQFVFADIMGDYASNATYLISPGGGLRTISSNQIIGAYFFGDYEQTSLGANFWNLSPGIEWITPEWDAHLNGYFPTTTSKIVGTTEYASALGNEDFVTFIPGTHNQYDALMTPYAVIGNGGDVELGYSFDENANHLRSRLYIGGYYYQTPNNTDTQNITGITAGFSQALSANWAVAIFNSYDQVSDYNVGLSLTFVLGGESNLFTHDVHTRLFDPVQRHVGIIGTGAGNYDQEYMQNDGLAVEYDNIYFVSPDGTGDGTYGNPMSLTQSNLDTTYADNPNGARLYLQGGTAAVYNIDSSSATSGLGLYVHDGEDFYGRSPDYQTTASNDEQPTIVVDGSNNYNGFITQGGENTFSDLTLYSSSPGNGAGITSSNNTSEAETLNIYNTTISQFNTAVYANNTSNGTYTVNAINAHFDNNTQSGSGAAAYGMNLLNTGTGDFIINANASSFDNNTSTGNTNQAAGLSIYNASSGSVTANLVNSTFNNNAAIGSNYPIAAGFYSYNNGDGVLTVNALNSQFNANSASDQAFGLDAINISSGTTIVNARDSQFNTNSADALSAGLAAGNYGSGLMTINNYRSTFYPSTSDNSYRIYTYNAGTGTININVY